MARCRAGWDKGQASPVSAVRVHSGQLPSVSLVPKDLVSPSPSSAAPRGVPAGAPTLHPGALARTQETADSCVVAHTPESPAVLGVQNCNLVGFC